MLLLALAAAPGLAICLYVFSRDIHNPEPKRYLAASFVLGMLLTVPAYFLETRLTALLPHDIAGVLLQSFLVIAVVEEGLKFLVLRYYCYRLSTFDEPLDGIIYSVMVSMGFATLENIAYPWMHGYSVLISRTFTSVPAHACFAAIMGYYAGLARFNPQKRNSLLRTGFLKAALFHGFYDGFLLLTEDQWIKKNVSEALLLTGAVYSLFVALRLSRRLFRQHRDLSKSYFGVGSGLEVTGANYQDLEPLQELAAEIMTAAEGFSDKENEQFLSGNRDSIETIRQQMAAGHHFLLARQSRPIGFASFGPEEENEWRLHYLFVSPAFRKQGAGKKLLEAVIKEVQERKGNKLLTDLQRRNPAVGFFTRKNFRIMDQYEVQVGDLTLEQVCLAYSLTAT